MNTPTNSAYTTETRFRLRNGKWIKYIIYANFPERNGVETKDSTYSQMHLLEGERTVDFHSNKAA